MQREIVILKRELAQSRTLLSQEYKVKPLNNRASTADKENEEQLINKKVQIGIDT